MFNSFIIEVKTNPEQQLLHTSIMAGKIVFPGDIFTLRNIQHFYFNINLNNFLDFTAMIFDLY